VPLEAELAAWLQAYTDDTTAPSRSSVAVRSRSSPRQSANEQADDSFLSRWSRRKVQGRSGPAEPAAAEPSQASAIPAAATPAVERPPFTPAPSATGAEDKGAHPQSVAPPAEPLPTMQDVAALTNQSDFSRFVRPGVDSGVRNAAMKKLFSDPHFNVMDGLDTYIDDYGKPDPIPPSMLRRMTQSAMLGLFDDEATADAPSIARNESAPPSVNPDGSLPTAVAQSPEPQQSASLPPPADTAPDDDPDLRLQQDDAVERAGPAPGPGG
jgi:hypothetical protein